MAFQRILCAVDFSPGSLEAFRIAVETARMYTGSLHLFHVVEAQPVVSEWLPIDAMGKMAVEIEEKAAAAMESLVGCARPRLAGLLLTSEVTSGRASAEIIRRAREWNADLIVLGSTGAATPLDEAVLGGTADRVMKEAACSVLIARKAEAQDNGVPM
jgi:nucleotide-binding universal stress UspA family protein